MSPSAGITQLCPVLSMVPKLRPFLNMISFISYTSGAVKFLVWIKFIEYTIYVLIEIAINTMENAKQQSNAKVQSGAKKVL